MNNYTSILKNRKSRTSDIKSDYTFKLVLIGEPGVGKTSIFNRIKDDVFSNHTTVGLDQCNKIVYLENGEIVKMNIWDTAGQERFQTITKNYYRNADAVLFVFGVNDLTSFTSLMKWNEDVENILCGETSKVLIGNKKDCTTVMSQRSLKDFCDVRNFENSFATSALNGEGIEEMLIFLSQHLILKNQPLSEYEPIELSNSDYKSPCSC